LKRINALALFLTLGVAGSRGFAAEPEAPPASPPPGAGTPSPAQAKTSVTVNVKRPEPPVPPLEYLKTGANLFNKARYDLAAKYLAAAHAYRDRLSENERVVLDVYREKLDEYRRGLQAPTSPPLPAPAPAAPATSMDPKPAPAEAPGDADVVAASTSSASSTDPAKGLTAPVPGPAAGAEAKPRPAPLRGTAAWRDTPDAKQKGRWLLQAARSEITKGQYDEAERLVEEVKTLNVRWGFLDDSPAKVTEALAKARAKAAKEGRPGSASNPAGTPAPDVPRDRRTAKARLREARAAMAAGRFDEAEQIVAQVRSWGVRFGLFDDTPDKVASELDEVRRRRALQETEAMVRSYLGSPADRGRDPRGVGPDPAAAPGPAVPR
jgi:hypothetical protein